MAEWQAAPDDATNPPGPATPATPPLSPDTTLAEATPRRAHTALSDADSTCVSQSEDERSARHVAGPEKSVAFAAARRPQRGIANVVERSWRQANANALRSAQPGLSGLASSSRLGNAAGAGELVGVGGLQERTAVGGSEDSSRNHSPATVSSASDVDQPMVVKRTASLSGASPPPPPPSCATKAKGFRCGTLLRWAWIWAGLWTSASMPTPCMPRCVCAANVLCMHEYMCKHVHNNTLYVYVYR